MNNQHIAGYLYVGVSHTEGAPGAIGTDAAQTEVRLRAVGRAGFALELRTSTDAGGQQQWQEWVPLQPRTTADHDLLTAAAKVLLRQLKQAPCSLVHVGEAGAVVQLALVLSNQVFDGKHNWEKSSARTLVLRSLVPVTDDLAARAKAVLDSSTAELDAAANAQRFSLLGCFNDIPPCEAPPPPPPMLLQTAAAPTADGHVPASFADMPQEVLAEVMARLEPSDVRNLACCCHHLRVIMRPEHCSRVPGLERLLLHDHQRAALQWMLDREKVDGLIEHPYIKCFVTNTGLPVFANQATGELKPDPPPQLKDTRGGLLCDDPGLGKTVTMIALVVRTKGTMPSPPAGAAVDISGMPASCYMQTAVLGRSQRGSRPEELMYLSSATLVVVPSQLIDHWLVQISRHVRRGLLRVGVLASSSSLETVLGGGAVGITLGKEKAHELASDFDIVITTFEVLSNQYSKDKTGRVPLKQVHWLRIILDEGHTLGTASATSKGEMSAAITAERRWIMTGTPTPDTASGGSDFSKLQPLFKFLHLQPFDVETEWKPAVQTPLKAKSEWGRGQLLSLLQRCMIRASKSALLLLPKCERKVVLLDFAKEHAQSWNDLVELIRNNLLMSDWWDDEHHESLLYPGNSQWASEMMSNVRLSCCLAGNTELATIDADILETLQLLAGRLDHPRPDGEAVTTAGMWLQSGHPLYHVEEGLRYGAGCEVCAAFTKQPIVTPCGHMACLDCIGQHRTCCPLPSCAMPYTMQAVTDPERKEDNDNPKWEVPVELIEWQPARAQSDATGASGGSWSAKWQVTQSSKVRYLLQRLREIGAVPHRHRDKQDNASLSSSSRGEGNNGVLVKETVRTKAIVFSQFHQHRLLIGTQLSKHKVPFKQYIKGLKAADRDAELRQFANSDSVGVLLMDASGALGLDLSFVTHVFLMEPIADRSVEQQVIARAHRMGARQTVHVEVLAMRNTAEQQLVDLEHGMLTEKDAQAAAREAATKIACAVDKSEVAATAGMPAIAHSIRRQMEKKRRKAAREARKKEGSSSAAINGAARMSQGVRNLVLLRLHKVSVCDLEDFQDDVQPPDAAPAAQVAPEALWADAFVGPNAWGVAVPPPPAPTAPAQAVAAAPVQPAVMAVPGLADAGGAASGSSGASSGDNGGDGGCAGGSGCGTAKDSEGSSSDLYVHAAQQPPGGANSSAKDAAVSGSTATDGHPDNSSNDIGASSSSNSFLASCRADASPAAKRICFTLPDAAVQVTAQLPASSMMLVHANGSSGDVVAGHSSRRNLVLEGLGGPQQRPFATTAALELTQNMDGAGAAELGAAALPCVLGAEAANGTPPASSSRDGAASKSRTCTISPSGAARRTSLAVGSWAAGSRSGGVAAGVPARKRVRLTNSGAADQHALGQTEALAIVSGSGVDRAGSQAGPSIGLPLTGVVAQQGHAPATTGADASSSARPSGSAQPAALGLTPAMAFAAGSGSIGVTGAAAGGTDAAHGAAGSSGTAHVSAAFPGTGPAACKRVRFA